MYTKVSYILFDHMKDFINASARIFYEKEWGYRNPNGTYGGMVGRIVSGDADLGGTK